MVERWLRLETSVDTTGSRSQQKQFWIPVPNNVSDCIEWAMGHLRKAECDSITERSVHCPSGRYIQIRDIDEVPPTQFGWVQVEPDFDSPSLILMVDWEMLERLIAIPIGEPFITHSLDDLFQALSQLPANVESYESLIMQVGVPAIYTLLEIINDLKQEVLSINLARAIGIQIKATLGSDRSGQPTWYYTGEGERTITFPSGNSFYAVGTIYRQKYRDDTVKWLPVVSCSDTTTPHTYRRPKSRSIWREFNKRFGRPR
jgi:hypothetical protein